MSEKFIAGIDEAGRGPLAGPVYAAAVILNPDVAINDLADSKKLSAKKREQIASDIKDKALAWAIAFSSVNEIDTINILQATMLAMTRACNNLSFQPDLVLIDGNRIPQDLSYKAKSIINGDASEPAISAASILAKTARDEYCLRLHLKYPQYAFDKHKGYGTALHKELLLQHGPCPEHRRSFAPIKNMLISG